MLACHGYCLNVSLALATILLKAPGSILPVTPGELHLAAALQQRKMVESELVALVILPQKKKTEYFFSSLNSWCFWLVGILVVSILLLLYQNT